MLDYVQRSIFKLFIFNVFFVYYETRFVPGTIHTWLMLFGTILLFPQLISRYYVRAENVSFDYVCVLVLLFLIFSGGVANISTSKPSNIQAYVLMLVTYIYVKENTTVNVVHFMKTIIQSFLVINGILMVLQTLTGGFFPARYLALDPPLVIASGVSDGPTKNGFLISFSLSYMLAHALFKRLSFGIFELFAFLIGVLSLILAASRAALLSFGVIVFLGIAFALIQSLKKREFRLNYTFVLFVFLFVVGVAGLLSHLSEGIELLAQYRNADVSNYGLAVIQHKSSNFMDESVGERFGTISYLAKLFFDSPLHFISVGYGPGSFETLYGLNVHNSWAEILVTTGLYGFLSFLVFVIYVVNRALKSENAVDIAPMIFALMSVMVFMAAHDIVRGRIFWVALGVIAGFNSIGLARQRISTKNLAKQDENITHYYQSR